MEGSREDIAAGRLETDPRILAGFPQKVNAAAALKYLFYMKNSPVLWNSGSQVGTTDETVLQDF